MNSIIDKIRSRSRSGINASYKIVNDFESSSEKECSKMDKENEKIYSRLLSQAEKAHQAIRNSGLSMNLEVPIPPRPSEKVPSAKRKKNTSKVFIVPHGATLMGIALQQNCSVRTLRRLNPELKYQSQLSGCEKSLKKKRGIFGLFG